MTKQYRSLIFIFIFVLLYISCGGKKTSPQQLRQTQTTPQQTIPDKAETSAMLTEKTETPNQAEKYVVISVKSADEYLGKIKIKLYTKEAPKTTENFIKLVNQGFYNGLTFHRVIPGFVIQGGDPKGDGTGGPGYTIPAEINANLKHIRGAVATARLSDQVNPTKASSGSQFYICHAPAPHLDGNYTIFGMVVEGMDVVDKIALVKTTPGNNKPIVPVVMEKVYLE
ncbi:MAG: peptidylprolyl isomerase [candidate division WOR-3 bacterium]